MVQNMNNQQPNRAFFLRFGYRIIYSLAKSSVFPSIWLKNRLRSQIFFLNLQHNNQLKNISYGANSRQKDRNHTVDRIF